jgi:beta-glucosidase
VEYSEGLDVGYRWYDAHNVTPLFPFGYGLSYTTFSFSHLTVSPGAEDSLGTVRVSATVTNTGRTIGSEVAQLYLGFPAAVGEPPRQLKGFQRVTLKPGKSARVQFTLTQASLSYYDTAAQAWAVADGSYQVYVGDSSALASLPLRGRFSVDASTGARNVTVHAPASVTAGKPVTVTTTLTAGGDLTLHSARLQLTAPEGWVVRARGPAQAGTLAPAAALTVSWEVTAPAGAQANVAQLAAAASFQAADGGTGTKAAWAEVAVNPS